MAKRYFAYLPGWRGVRPVLTHGDAPLQVSPLFHCTNGCVWDSCLADRAWPSTAPLFQGVSWAGWGSAQHNIW